MMHAIYSLSSSAAEERRDENLIKKTNGWEDLVVDLLRPARLRHP